MRVLAVCAALVAAGPASLLAAEFEPAKCAFAYSARHAPSHLPPAVVHALRPPADAPDFVKPAEAGEAPPKAPRPFTRGELCSAAASVAEANDLPIPFFANLIQQESGWRPYVVSPAGAQGIAQFMPRVARAYGLNNPFDPIHALAVSGKFLRELLQQFGNLGLAAAAYNAGPKRVQDWIAKRGNLPAETRDYVRNITGHPADRWRVAKAQGHRLPAYARCPDAATREAQALERGKREVKVVMPSLRQARAPPAKQKKPVQLTAQHGEKTKSRAVQRRKAGAARRRPGAAPDRARTAVKTAVKNGKAKTRHRAAKAAVKKPPGRPPKKTAEYSVARPRS
jgi:hypothetical protein